MKRWICFKMLMVFVFASYMVKAQPYNIDTNKIKVQSSDEISNMIDNLATLKIFPDTASKSCLVSNPFFFSNNSKISHSDSIYRTGIYSLSLSSPFEYVFNDIVKTYIELYGIKKAALTSRMIGLAELYFPLFEEYLGKYCLPLELKYLAVIESALNPIARSRSGATGIWQFMINTGKLYGLKVTSYIDDRRDPLKSTIAACEHLRDLYSTFNDWALAIAAYNSGAGNVNKAIMRAKLGKNEKPTFWKIKDFLPRETQNYVPAFIGVSYVMENYQQFGIVPVKPDLTFYEIDTFIIKKPLTFEQIEQVLCIPYDEIAFLNPVYTKGFIPASNNNPQVLRIRKNYVTEYLENEYTLFTYENKVVSSMYAQQISAIYKTENDKTKTDTNSIVHANVYYVKKGESLNIIARKFNCSVNDIMKWNNLKNLTIHPNQKLLVSNPETVPANNNADSATVVQTPDKVIKLDNKNSKIIYHTIRKGDTLWGIANQYDGVTIEEIRRLNNIKADQKLMPGQKLKIAISS